MNYRPVPPCQAQIFTSLIIKQNIQQLIFQEDGECEDASKTLKGYFWLLTAGCLLDQDVI
jgi:hypothetical protein